MRLGTIDRPQPHFMRASRTAARLRIAYICFGKNQIVGMLEFIGYTNFTRSGRHAAAFGGDAYG